jgi:hypothetical protein
VVSGGEKPNFQPFLETSLVQGFQFVVCAVLALEAELREVANDTRLRQYQIDAVGMTAYQVSQVVNFGTFFCLFSDEILEAEKRGCLCGQRLVAHKVAQYLGFATSSIERGADQGKILAVKPAKQASWSLPLPVLAVVLSVHGLPLWLGTWTHALSQT